MRFFHVTDERETFQDRWRLLRVGADREIMTKRQVQKLPRSVSSIWWSGKHRLTHDQQAVEVLVVVNDEMDESERKYRILHIRLSDGSVIK